jgi:hypothetical protein
MTLFWLGFLTAFGVSFVVAGLLILFCEIKAGLSSEDSRME